MPETGREVSDERSTPTGRLVTGLVELERRGSRSPTPRIEGASRVAGPRESRGMPLENPPRHCKVQSPGKREVSPGDCRVPCQPELRAAYAAIPRLLPEPFEEPACADEVKDFRGEAATSESRACFCEL